MSSPTYATPRSRWPWVIAAIAAITLVVLLVSRDGETAPAQPPSETATSAVPEVNTFQPADGCLGGKNPDVAVLKAQKNAPLTGEGAAAFLATYTRWHMETPKPVDDVAEIGAQVWVPGLDAKWKIMPDADDGPFQISIKGHHYEVRSVDDAVAIVALTYDFVDDTGTPVGLAGGVHRVQVVEGHWRYAGLDEQAHRDASGADRGAAFRAALAAEGIPFEGGC